MSKYSELFPDNYVDETGNTRIDGDIVSLNNSLNVTDSDITAKQPATFESTQFNDDNVYFKNQIVQNSGNLPDGYVTLGFDRGIPYFSSADFEGGFKFIDARGMRIIDSTDFDLDLNDEFIILGSSSSNQYNVNLPDNPYVNVHVHYIGAIGADTPSAILDAGNKEIVMHVRASNGTLQEVYRDNTLLINTSTRQSFRYVVVSTNPLVTEWHGTVGVSF